MPIPAEFHPRYFTLDERDGVTVVAFTSSHLTDEENIEQLGHEMFALVEQFNCRRVVVSLAPVEFLTSSVLGKLITLHRRLHRQNGRLAICDIRPPVADVLHTSRLISYFSTCLDVDSAVAMLNEPGSPG